jgi:transcriptional regulator with PAS, ATPase and Fis domain
MALHPAVRRAQREHEQAAQDRARAHEHTQARDAWLREAYEAGEADIPELAQLLGVSKETVSKAVGRPRSTAIRERSGA